MSLAAFAPKLQAQALGLLPAAVNVSNITSIASPHDGSGRIFMTLQNGGLIKILGNGIVSPTNFLNISSLIVTQNDEEGLLGLAFSPGYATDGIFYITYTGSNGDVILSRYSVSPDPNVANPVGSILLDIPHPSFGNHNGGQLQFGPDGYLYMSVGDGGSGCDPFNNAQNLGVMLGKILRIDVSTNVGYAIPPTNPFVGVPGTAPEIWAYGLRNPWRFSFDRLTGDLYIADAGESQEEEVDFQPAGDSGGENYGWRIYEGLLTNTCAVTVSNIPSTLPIFVYGHTNGNCVIVGGYVYRGAKYPPLVGSYIYADFCSGSLAIARTNGMGGWSETQVLRTNYNFSTFGEDEAGELYVADYGSGTLLRITLPDTVGDGIPDWWRAQYFGGTGATTNGASCAKCDPDGDGMSNYQEFNLGTDPTNSASSFRVTAIAQNSNDLVITWLTVGGTTNVVQGTTGAGDGSYSNGFADLGPPLLVAGGGLTITNYLCVGCATNSVSAYYRVKVPQPIADDTSDQAYDAGWFPRSNGGSGFTPWVMIGGNLGRFSINLVTSSSTNNGNGDSPGIDIAGKSWAVPSTSNAFTSVAFRAFAGGPLLVGQSFRLSIDTGYPDPGYVSGFALRNGYIQSRSTDFSRGARFQFLFNSSNPSNTYQVIDAAGQYNIGVPFTDTGLRLVFTLTSVDTYTLLVIDNATGVTNATVNGTLAGSGHTIDSFAFSNNSSIPRDTFFINSLSVTGP